MGIEQEPKAFNVSKEQPGNIELVSEKEYLSNQIKRVRNGFLEHYGVELTNIELVGLRRIAEVVIKEYIEQEKKPDLNKGSNDFSSRFRPEDEIWARFVLEFYGLNPTDERELFKDNGSEEIREYFRRKQASLHMP